MKKISTGKDVDHVICVGDFNATPDERAIGIMSDPKNQLTSAYLDGKNIKNIFKINKNLNCTGMFFGRCFRI